jgi:ubiquinone/menaquinone biosynthesis C-methylase UbiE
MSNPIVETYSRLAYQYDDEVNMHSCWGRAADEALNSIRIVSPYRVVLDVGCGTGRALVRLASESRPDVRFIGIDPAENMRKRAVQRAGSVSNIEIREGSFEFIPMEPASVDYLFSIFAFHWTTDLNQSVTEMARVLKPEGEMDLFFIGRNNGREFIEQTTPIFLQYLGPKRLLESAGLRKQLKREEAFRLFSRAFEPSRLSVQESYNTYYDSLEGHWGWWVRIEGHFVQMPIVTKQQCDQKVKEALQNLSSQQGIPYTIHRLHVRLRRT